MKQENLELYLKLVELERLLEKDRHHYIREYGPLSDVAHGQGRILAYLKLDGTLSVKELAERLNIRPQSLNDHLNRMIRDGLVVKEQSPEDKRVMLISLTQKAQDLELSERDYTEIFTGIDQEELENFSNCLSKVIDNLKIITDNIIEEEPPRPVAPPHLRGEAGPRPPRPEEPGRVHPKPHLRVPHPGEPVPPHLGEPRPPHLRGPEGGERPEMRPVPEEFAPVPDELSLKQKELISRQVLTEFNDLVDLLMEQLKGSGLIEEDQNDESVEMVSEETYESE